MKKTLAFLLVFATSYSISAPSQSVSLEDFTKAFQANVAVRDGGTLMIKEDAEKTLSTTLVNGIRDFVDLLNEDVANGKLKPFTENSIRDFPPLLCECLLGCCLPNGYCYVNWGTYIGMYRCQP